MKVTQWAAFHHTSRKYGFQNQRRQYHSLKPLPIVDMSKANCDIMCNWASAYGAAVRQRTVRQETTMAKHGNLPEFICQSQLLLNQWMTADHPVLYKMKPNQSTSSLTTSVDKLSCYSVSHHDDSLYNFFYEIENRFETKKTRQRKS